MHNFLRPSRVFSAFLFLLFITAFAARAYAQSPSPAFAPFMQQRQTQDRARMDSYGERSYKNYAPQYEDAYEADYDAPPSSQPYANPPQPYEAQRFAPPPAANLPKQEEKSTIEELYSRRIVDELEQFGYDLFGDTSSVYPAEIMSSPAYYPPSGQRLGSFAGQTPLGAVQDDFILGSGDQLEITFTGQRNDRNLYTINNKGHLVISDFPPIPAAGRTIAQVRLSLEAAARNLHNTEAYLSLASVRQIGVLVVGHVKRPGRQNLTVFHTVLDALMQAGGVDKTGSLRQIKLVRNGRSAIVDLYALLNFGATSMDLNLRDGDRLIVPPIGPTVAIAGEAKRPGIYEIQQNLQGMRLKPKEASESLSLNDMLDLAGGVLSPGQNRFIKLDLTDDGHETVEEVHDSFAPVFGDGAVLMISKGTEKRSGTVELVGHTRKPGIYALDEVKTLSSLINSEQVLGADAYPLIGVIERWDGDQLTGKLISYPLRLVLKKKYDMRLRDGDVVHIFSQKQITSLRDDIVGSPQDKKFQNAEERYAARREERERRQRLMGEGSVNEKQEEPDSVEDEVLHGFLLERAAFIRGAVRLPGAYPVAEGTTLDSLIAVAGGLTLEANTTHIEVTSALNGEGGQAHGRSGTRRLSVDFREKAPTDILVEAGDAVRVNQKFEKVKDNSVLIIGEVGSPGRYDLLPGDKLSHLLARAGGLTSQAYPEGAIFSRETERRAEEARFKSQARELERAIALALSDESEKVERTKIMEARALAKELREAEGVGRITVEADPSALAAQPELDLLLEPGDRIYVPRRSLNVRVSGEVLSPAALQFRKDKNASDYIQEAGGFTFHADKDRTFVLYPDGSAQPLQVSAWNYSPAMIPPGSTIIVPNDPEPFDFIESAKEISQILSNLAITGIFIDDIRDD